MTPSDRGLGQARSPSLLETDGYKFSMAEAGFPLREETFQYVHRKGGWQLLPLDLRAWVLENLPQPAPTDWAFLDRHGYRMGGAYRAAIAQRDQVRVSALPQGSWFGEREPILTVSGPSALVSWLEPLVLQLHFRIQVATAAALERLPAELVFTCERERELYEQVLDGVRPRVRPTAVRVAPDEYHDAVLARARALVALVGDPDRLFEVGMRAASCSEQHEIALRAVRDAGIRRTSNVAAAERLGMVPVGTMGHEHVQRHGSDRAAFTAMRDRFPGFVFYLPDTFDTLSSGIPAALAAMREAPTRNAGIRFDSEHGIVAHYLYAVARAREYGLQPLLGLESGWNDRLTAQFEDLRRQVGWPAERQAYGYGGYLVRPPWPSFQRDDVSAVYKIGWTGGRATMKFGDEPGGGKSSIPGRPVVLRPRTFDARGPVGVIAQEGEDWSPPDSVRATDAAEPQQHALDAVRTWTGGRLTWSPATAALIEACEARRAADIRDGR